MNKVPETKEELIALTNQYDNAYYIVEQSDDAEQREMAWDKIELCETLFEQAKCWLDEDGNFVEEEQ